MQKRVVISGGTRGIGLALVNGFAEIGFDVCFNGRDHQKASAVAVALQEKYPNVSIQGIGADLSTKAGCVLFAEKILATKNEVDILINNAGQFLPGSIETEADGTFEQLIAANVASAYYLTRALLPTLIAKKGHIFNMCSIASITAYINGGSYCISKFALLGMNKVLREEMKPHGVRVTAVLPGATLTDSWADAGLPENRLMPAEDIANAVIGCYKLSNRSVIEELIIRPQLGDI